MIPDLVDELRKLVDNQYWEADRALCGRRIHMLRPDYQRYRVTVEQWMEMTEVQRQRARDTTQESINGQNYQHWNFILWNKKKSYPCGLWSPGVQCGPMRCLVWPVLSRCLESPVLSDVWLDFRKYCWIEFSLFIFLSFSILIITIYKVSSRTFTYEEK